MANPGIVKPYMLYLMGFVIGGTQQIEDFQTDTYTIYGIDFSQSGFSKVQYPVYPVINNVNYLSWFSQSFSDATSGEDLYEALITSYSSSNSLSVDSNTGKATMKFTASVSFNTSVPNSSNQYGILQICLTTQAGLMTSTTSTNAVRILIAEYKPANAITQSPTNIEFDIVLNG